MASLIGVPLDRPDVPRRHPITVDEYFRMGETGVLAPDARVELIEGEMIDMPPIGPPHSSRVSLLTQRLVLATIGKAVLSPQNPVVLGDLSAPEPDIALLRWRADFYRTAHPRPEDILLIAEVSDTSRVYDRGTKLPLYARFDVPEAWIVDIPGGHLDVHRDPDGERYTTQLRVRDRSRVEVAALPGVAVDLSELS